MKLFCKIMLAIGLFFVPSLAFSATTYTLHQYQNPQYNANWFAETSVMTLNANTGVLTATPTTWDGVHALSGYITMLVVMKHTDDGNGVCANSRYQTIQYILPQSNVYPPEPPSDNVCPVNPCADKALLPAETLCVSGDFNPGDKFSNDGCLAEFVGGFTLTRYDADHNKMTCGDLKYTSTPSNLPITDEPGTPATLPSETDPLVAPNPTTPTPVTPENVAPASDPSQTANNAIHNDIRTLDSDLKALKTDINNGISQSVNNAEAIISAIKIAAFNLASKLDGQSNDSDLGAKVDGVGNSVDALGSKIDGVGNSVDALGSKIDGVGNSVDGLGTKIDGIGEKIEDLKNVKGDWASITENVYDTEVEELEESPFLEHVTNFISSGLPIISAIQGTRLTASGSPILTETFFGQSFTADFSDWLFILHACGLILMFIATITAFRIVTGG